jgi:hypothetical protein
MRIGMGVHSFVEKCPFIGLFRYYLTIKGSTEVFTSPSQSLNMFGGINNLTIGRYRVHNLTIPEASDEPFPSLIQSSSRSQWLYFPTIFT